MSKPYLAKPRRNKPTKLIHITHGKLLHLHTSTGGSLQRIIILQKKTQFAKSHETATHATRQQKSSSNSPKSVPTSVPSAGADHMDIRLSRSAFCSNPRGIFWRQSAEGFWCNSSAEKPRKTKRWQGKPQCMGHDSLEKRRIKTCISLQIHQKSSKVKYPIPV